MKSIRLNQLIKPNTVYVVPKGRAGSSLEAVLAPQTAFKGHVLTSGFTHEVALYCVNSPSAPQPAEAERVPARRKKPRGIFCPCGATAAAGENQLALRPISWAGRGTYHRKHIAMRCLRRMDPPGRALAAFLVGCLGILSGSAPFCDDRRF